MFISIIYLLTTHNSDVKSLRIDCFKYEWSLFLLLHCWILNDSVISVISFVLITWDVSLPEEE